MTSRGSIASQIAAATTLVLAWLVTSAPAVAQNAYITNFQGGSGPGTVSVIDTTQTPPVVTATITLGAFDEPLGVAVTSDGKKVYVATGVDIVVIDTASNTFTTITVGGSPRGVAVSPDGSHVYVTNFDANLTVIDTASNAITTLTLVGILTGVAVTPDGSKVYVGNINNTVSVISTATNAVSPPIPVSNGSIFGVAVTPDGKNVWVANGGGSVTDIATATNTVTQTITLDPTSSAIGVAVAPDGSRVYVTNQGANTVSVIDTTLNLPAVTATIPVLVQPYGVGVTPDGKHVYVALEGIPNQAPGTGVSVIDTATNTVVNTITTTGCSDLPCSGPAAFGLFIQPSPPKFVGTPGSANCNGASVSALSNQYGNNLAAAATAKGFASVKALQNAIKTFCAG